MRFLKIFVIGLLFWITPIMSNTVGGFGDPGYRVITFTTGIKESLQNNPEWKMCGEIFATREIEKEKIVLFGFEKKSSGDLSPVMTFAFANVEWVAASINEKVTSPVVIVMGREGSERFSLRMNMEDYKTGLPCFGKGLEV